MFQFKKYIYHSDALHNVSTLEIFYLHFHFAPKIEERENQYLILFVGFSKNRESTLKIILWFALSSVLNFANDVYSPANWNKNKEENKIGQSASRLSLLKIKMLIGS